MVHAYLEREACVVRRGRGGQVRERGQGFVAAAFRHRTSRAQDPHLHTHVIVANQARSSDGKWRALDGEAILRTYRLAAGYLYEAHLRHELSASLGVTWTEPVKGMAEIEGVPQEAIRAFSTRRQSLVEHMEAIGTSGFAASRVAALATRERKEAVDLPDLRVSWLARASEMGLGAIELRGLLEREPARELELPTIAADELTAHQATITTPELVRAVAGAARHGASVETVLAGVDELVRGPELTRVGDDATPGRPARFTTRSLLELEREVLRIALAGRAAGAPRAEASGLMMALSQCPVSLSDEQRALVEATALSPDRVVCVEGAAGAGKTTALRVLGDALAHSNVPGLGAAPSGRAADELERAIDIPAQTLHFLLADARRSGGLPPRCVLVIDEAGMAETRVLGPVLSLVDEAGGKAVLVGDPAQLPAVGAGGLYAALCERLGAERLIENRRQRELAEREALARLRSGDAEGYLGHAARQGRLLVVDDPTEAKAEAPGRLVARCRRGRPARDRDARPPAGRRARAERGRTGPAPAAGPARRDRPRCRRSRLPRRRPGGLPTQRPSPRCAQRHVRVGARGGSRARHRHAAGRRRDSAPAAGPLRGRAPRARLRAHRPRRPGGERRAGLRPRARRGSARRVGLCRRLARPGRDAPLRGRTRARRRCHARAR